MAELTITEALAEIKTIDKRINKRREGLLPYLARQDGIKDPFEKNGGSADFIARERQAISDLEERKVELRRRIAAANASTEISVNGESRTIADWLTWRREVAPGLQAFLNRLHSQLINVRQQAQQQGASVYAAAAAVQIGEVKPTDLIVNLDEGALVAEIDHIEEALGGLDGLLSLKNATTTI